MEVEFLRLLMMVEPNERAAVLAELLKIAESAKDLPTATKTVESPP